MRKIFILLYLVTFFGEGSAKPAQESTLLICGVCKDIEDAVPNTIKNIEELGHQFKDYRVIIYENNSIDNTVQKIHSWTLANPKVSFYTETLLDAELPISRTERVARARNIVLDIASGHYFDDFEYLIMVDLDFKMNWPIDVIVEVVESPKEWDCVSANSLLPNGDYWDRYAFRDRNFPLGPENIGGSWWEDVKCSWFKLEGEDWKPVYSAFGGLAIYKKDVITQFRYSGTVTKDLKKFYRSIIREVDTSNPQMQKYLKWLGKGSFRYREQIPVKFQNGTPWNQPKKYKKITCCEHLPLHASMFVNGHNKFYVHPGMFMYYFSED